MENQEDIQVRLINVTNRKNILKQTYISGAKSPIRENYQLGFLPQFY